MQTRELPVGPIGIIGLNTLSNADGRLNGSAIVVCGHAIHTFDSIRNVHPSRYGKLHFLFLLISFLLVFYLLSFLPNPRQLGLPTEIACTS